MSLLHEALVWEALFEVPRQAERLLILVSGLYLETSKTLFCQQMLSPLYEAVVIVREVLLEAPKQAEKPQMLVGGLYLECHVLLSGTDLSPPRGTGLRGSMRGTQTSRKTTDVGKWSLFSIVCQQMLISLLHEALVWEALCEEPEQAERPQMLVGDLYFGS